MEIIYLIILCTLMSGTSGQSPHESTTGAFFLNKGTVTITQSSWGLMLEMDTDGIDKCLEQLRKEIDDMTSHSWPLALTTEEEKFLTGLTRFVEASAQMFLEQTMDLQDQSMDIKNLLLGKKRVKRHNDNHMSSDAETMLSAKLSQRPVDIMKHMIGLAAYQDVLLLQSKIDHLHQDEVVFAEAWEQTMKTLNQTAHLLASLNQYMLRNLTTISHRLRSIVNAAHRDHSGSHLFHVARDKRSLAPGLGHLLQNLAGVATDDDINEIRQRLGLLHESQEKIQHIVDQSVTLINITHFQAKANAQHVVQLQQETEILRTALVNLSLRFEKYQDISTGEVLVIIEILSMMNKVSATIRTVTNSIQTVMESLTSLINGKLSPVLVPPHELIEILEGIDQQLPVGLSLPANPQKNVLFYYDTSRVLILPASHGYSILVIIPLRPESEQYTIYQVIPIPMQLPNSNSYVYLKTDYNYFAVSSDRTKFFYPKERNILRCLEHRMDICQVKAPLYAISDRTCLPALFNHDLVKAVNVCERRVKIFSEPTTTITYIENGNWLLQPFRSQRLVITCPTVDGQNLDSKVMQLTKPQIVTLEQGCSAHGDAFYLPRYYHQTTKLIPKILLGKMINVIDQSKFFKDLMDLGNITSFENATIIPEFVKPKALPEMGNIDVSIRDLKSAIKQNKQLLTEYDDMDPRFPSVGYSHIGFIKRNWLLITVLMVLGISLVIVYFIRRRRHSGALWWRFWQPSPNPVVLPTTAQPPGYSSHEAVPLQTREIGSFIHVSAPSAASINEQTKEATV